MSWRPSEDPVPGDRRSCDALDVVIVPRGRDLGGFNVRRALPSAQRQMVGPFIFWDQMGPADFGAGEGIEVRPSSGGNYTGLTVTVRALNREHLDDIYRALTGHPMVKVVL